MLHRPSPTVTPTSSLSSAQPAVHVVKGHAEVLAQAQFLQRFGEQCGQPGAMQDLGYFLSKPGVMARMPYLLLVSREQRLDTAHPQIDDLLGALLIFEYRAMGNPTGGFATNDRSGRGTLLARPGLEQEVVA